jgi:hypothetical protein
MSAWSAIKWLVEIEDEQAWAGKTDARTVKYPAPVGESVPVEFTEDCFSLMFYN